jgi:hypothetical protein
MKYINNFNYYKIFSSELLIQLLPIPASIILNRLMGPNARGELAEILLIPGLLATIICCNWDKFLKGEILNNRYNLNSIVEKTILDLGHSSFFQV